MIVSLRKWAERIKFMLLFVVLTVIVYVLFQLFSSWMDSLQRHKEPSGRAVKAFQQLPQKENGSMLERLMFFYRYGE